MSAVLYYVYGPDGDYSGTAEELALTLGASTTTIRKHARDGTPYRGRIIEDSGLKVVGNRRPAERTNVAERYAALDEIKITPEMVAEVRARLHVGDVVTISAINWDKEDAQGRPTWERIRVPVVSKSRHTFNVRRRGGWLESYSYADLYRHDHIKRGEQEDGQD